MGKQSTTPSPRRTTLPLWIALIALLICAAPAQAQTTPLLLPSAIVFDTQGNLYIAETGNQAIRKIDTTGNLTTIAGTGTQGYSGDNGPATAAQLDSPQGLAIDANQNLYLADTHNQVIRKLSLTTGIITTIAGNGTQGYSGDNGPATTAQFDLPTALALDTNQNLYIADSANHRIREINSTTGIVTTIAGNGIQGFSGDNGLATVANIDSPTGIAIDTAGNLYLADTHNQRIREINSATGIITTIAGTGAAGYSGDNASATTASLALPHGLSIDPAGNLYLADTANHRIREINAATGQITTIAGNGTQGFSGDNAPATAATLDSPLAVDLPSTNLITLADTANQRIRQLDSAAPPNIHTYAGTAALIPDTLAITGSASTTYGTGQITISLATTTSATGSITLTDLASGTTTTLGTPTLSANAAAFSIATLPAGTNTFTATYAGDATHAAAQSAPFTITITPQPITATIAPVTLLYGQPIPQLTGTLTGAIPQDAASLSAIFTTQATSLSPPGTYPLTATLTGPAAGDYTLSAAPVTLTIRQAPVAIIITITTTGATAPITITTQVATTTTGTPTGTITLLDTGTTLDAFTLPITGQTSFTTSTLTTGTHTFTAVYSGDTDFAASTSAPTTLTLGTASGTSVGTSSGSDFALATTGTTTQTVVSGGSATFSLSFQSSGTSLSSPIALTATGLPSLATASFNPAYLPPGTTSQAFTMTITTPGAVASGSRSISPIAIALLLFPAAGITLRRRKLQGASLLALLLAAFTLCSGCGNRIRTDNLGTAAPTPYTITVTGTATTSTGSVLQRTATVILLMQQTGS
jgi:sugar lactone lactonase YvrE